MRSHNPPGENSTEVFSFYFYRVLCYFISKKSLEILQVTSLQYIISILTFSHVSILAPCLFLEDMIVNAKEFQKRAIPMCGHRKWPPTGIILLCLPFSNKHTERPLLVLNSSSLKSPLQSYQQLSPKGHSKMQICNHWGTVKYEVLASTSSNHHVSE